MMLQMRSEPDASPEARSSAELDGLPMPRRVWAIVAISFGTALFVVDGAIANVALPTISHDLGVSNGVVTAVVTVYQLMMVMVLLPAATLGDRIGHRRLYQIGQVLFCLASAAAFFVSSFPMLMIVRAAQAFGAGLALSVSAAMLRTIYPARSLGSGLGLNSVIVASANAAAPTLGGFIVAEFDWRWVFAAAAPLAIASLAIGRTLPDPEPRAGNFDWLSGLWSALTLALLVGGVEIAAHTALVPGLAAIAAGGLSAWFLVRHERRVERPILPVDLMARPALGLSVVAAVAGFVGSALLIVALPFRFEQAFGYPPAQVGLLLAPFPLTLLVVAPAAGWLSDRISPSVMGVVGMAIAIAGLAFIAFMPGHARPFEIAWRLSLWALGYGLFFAPISRLMFGAAAMERSAAAGGLLSTSRLFGQTLGAALVGVLLALGLGLGPAPALVAAAFALIAMATSAFRFKATGANFRRVRPAT
jgi:DHA2 family multidrug resistance protein-like MFS transporter